MTAGAAWTPTPAEAEAHLRLLAALAPEPRRVAPRPLCTHVPKRRKSAESGLGQSANTLTPPPDNTSGDHTSPEFSRPLRAKLAKLRATAAELEPRHSWKCSADGGSLPSRISLCSWAPMDAGSIIMHTRTSPTGHTSAGWSGVQRCGSVWSCAECAAVVMGERAREVQHVVNASMGLGRFVYMVTLTVRHSYGDSLQAMREGVSEAWTSTINGKPWSKRRLRYGLDYVRRLEATVGANGWHPHLHLLVASDRPISPFEGDHGEPSFWEWMRERWNANVAESLGARHVGEAPYDMVVEEVHHADGASKYLAKLGLEMTDAFGRKVARTGARTPWGVLGSVAEHLHREHLLDAKEQARVERDAALWLEWSKAMHGARALTWSRGWRAKVGLGKEKRDEVIAQRIEADAVPVAVFPNEHARELRKLHVALPLRAAIEKNPTVDAIALVLSRVAGGGVSEAFLAANAACDHDALRAVMEERREYLRAVLSETPQEAARVPWTPDDFGLACELAKERKLYALSPKGAANIRKTRALAARKRRKLHAERQAAARLRLEEAYQARGDDIAEYFEAREREAEGAQAS